MNLKMNVRGIHTYAIDDNDAAAWGTYSNCHMARASTMRFLIGNGKLRNVL